MDTPQIDFYEKTKNKNKKKPQTIKLATSKQHIFKEF